MPQQALLLDPADLQFDNVRLGQVRPSVNHIRHYHHSACQVALCGLLQHTFVLLEDSAACMIPDQQFCTAPRATPSALP